MKFSKMAEQYFKFKTSNELMEVYIYAQIRCSAEFNRGEIESTDLSPVIDTELGISQQDCCMFYCLPDVCKIFT